MQTSNCKDALLVPFDCLVQVRGLLATMLASRAAFRYLAVLRQWHPFNRHAPTSGAAWVAPALWELFEEHGAARSGPGAPVLY